MKYLYPKQVLYLYQRIIQDSGGTIGLRDEGLLESAVYRPQASFGGQDLYADLFSKAAVLGHSIISNHPFVDGNKRVGFEAMRLMLRLNGYDLRASLDAKYDFVIEIAKGKLSEQAIADWLKQHTRPFRKGVEK
ncbi:MAG: type II toxin-antitoxin system death-on-curing family toxin [Candidatus Omnitrophica bacterium]|nr:type II toxin-antitoxin system death-on-curing family toxin [Candidatus Omnitrophota bacterium]